MRNIWYHAKWRRTDDDVSVFDGSVSTIASPLLARIRKDYEAFTSNEMDYVNVLNHSPFKGMVCCSTIHQHLYIAHRNSDICRFDMKETIIEIQTGVGHALCLTKSGFVHEFKSNCIIKKELCEIQSIHVGSTYNFCIDKNQNVFYFGHNICNVFGLTTDDDEQIRPMLHEYFSVRNVMKIQCGYYGCLAIDSTGHSYMTGRFNTIIQSMNDAPPVEHHEILDLQAVIDYKYGKTNSIVNGVVTDKEGESEWNVYMVDHHNRLIVLSNQGIQRKTIKGMDKHIKLCSLCIKKNVLFFVVSKA
eukprot:910631_1